MKCTTCDRPLNPDPDVHFCSGCLQPHGVVIYDADADRLVQPTTFRVEHEGRQRVLRLRVGRGDIRDDQSPTTRGTDA